MTTKTLYSLMLNMSFAYMALGSSFDAGAFESNMTAGQVQQINDASHDNAQQVSSFKSMWVANSATFPSDKTIYLDKVDMSFSPQWLKEFSGKTSEHYRARVKKSYSNALYTQLSNHLSKAGWHVVKTKQADSLTMKVKLSDLYIVAPQSDLVKTKLVSHIGKSDINIDLYDTNGETILKIEDTRLAGSRSNEYVEANRASNFSWFNRLMSQWARTVTPYIDLLAEVAQKEQTS